MLGQLCKACPDNFALCKNASFALQCRGDQQYLVPAGGRCSASCIDGYYPHSGVALDENGPLVGGTCERCVAPCETCLSATECKTCKGGVFEEPVISARSSASACTYSAYSMMDSIALWPFGRPTARLGGPAICPTLPNARAFERTCGGYVQPDGSYGPRQSALMAKEWREAEPWPREIGCRAPAAYRKDRCTALTIFVCVKQESEMLLLSHELDEHSAEAARAKRHELLAPSKARPRDVTRHHLAAERDAFLSKLETVAVSVSSNRVLESLAPERGIFQKPYTEVELPLALMELYWKKREGFAPRRHSVGTALGIDASSGRQSLLDEKKLQMLGISLKRHEHLNQGVKGAEAHEAIASIKCAILRCDFDVLHIECLSVIRTVIKQHENDGQPVTSFVAQNGEESIHSLRCPIEHRLVYELCKSQTEIPAAPTMEDRGDAEQIFVHAAFLDAEFASESLRASRWCKHFGRFVPFGIGAAGFVEQGVAKELDARKAQALVRCRLELVAGLRVKRIALYKATRVFSLPKRLLQSNCYPRDACGQERLRIAFQIAEEHVATGGTYAQVFLAPLVLPELSNKVRFWMDSEAG
eukprot:g10562.t1